MIKNIFKICKKITFLLKNNNFCMMYKIRYQEKSHQENSHPNNPHPSNSPPGKFLPGKFPPGIFPPMFLNIPT